MREHEQWARTISQICQTLFLCARTCVRVCVWPLCIIFFVQSKEKAAYTWSLHTCKKERAVILTFPCVLRPALAREVCKGTQQDPWFIKFPGLSSNCWYQFKVPTEIRAPVFVHGKVDLARKITQMWQITVLLYPFYRVNSPGKLSIVPQSH